MHERFEDASRPRRVVILNEVKDPAHVIWVAHTLSRDR